MNERDKEIHSLLSDAKNKNGELEEQNRILKAKNQMLATSNLLLKSSNAFLNNNLTAYEAARKGMQDKVDEYSKSGSETCCVEN